MRTLAWFSCGAASAVAAKISNPDLICYCDTGSEDFDNARFLKDCEKWFSKRVTILKSEKYSSIWDVFRSKKYMSGVKGAPCTYELKRKVREQFQLPGDVHIFGYTYDKRDMMRAEALAEKYPDLKFKFPLIENKLTKKNCLAIVENAGLKLPRVYKFGFPNANCIPCVKATSPSYWALIRKHFPYEFEKAAKMSREIGCKLTRLKGKRIYLDELPEDVPIRDPIAPECDFLCQLTLDELTSD